jgi:hypothetical protein
VDTGLLQETPGEFVDTGLPGETPGEFVDTGLLQETPGESVDTGLLQETPGESVDTGLLQETAEESVETGLPGETAGKSVHVGLLQEIARESEVDSMLCFLTSGSFSSPKNDCWAAKSVFFLHISFSFFSSEISVKEGKRPIGNMAHFRPKKKNAVFPVTRPTLFFTPRP